MELEQKQPKWSQSFTQTITLFLYGIGALIILPLFVLLLMITLFLYGIGAILFSTSRALIFSLHYSYMELEPAFIIIVNLSFNIITLFLYGIGALECQPLCLLYQSITLFLYGIGANVSQDCRLVSIYYIIPIWNWSYVYLFIIATSTVLHYSYMELELMTSYYCC